MNGESHVSGFVGLLECLSMYPVAAANNFTLVVYAYDLTFIRVELYLPVPFQLL